MTLMIVGLIIFLGIHSVAIIAPVWRDRQVIRYGEAAWKGVYTAFSLVGFALIIYGYAVARHTPILLYMSPHVLRHISLLLLIPVFPLLFAAYLPGRISTAVKHPMLLAVKIWATAHLLANGTLHDVVLFGAFLVWAIADRISVKHRSNERQIPRAPRSPANDAVAVMSGLLVYGVVLMWAHLWLIGVSPLT